MIVLPGGEDRSRVEQPGVYLVLVRGEASTRFSQARPSRSVLPLRQYRHSPRQTLAAAAASPLSIVQARAVRKLPYSRWICSVQPA